MDNAKDVDVVMLMYNVIQSSDNYSTTSGRLWQYYREEISLIDSGILDNFVFRKVILRSSIIFCLSSVSSFRYFLIMFNL